jgi:hypothetical protein
MTENTPNNTTWIWIAIIIVVILGFIFYTQAVKPSPTPSPTSTQSNEISWDQAIENIQEYKTVCGVIVDIGEDAEYGGIFLNMGNSFPDEDRFTIVFWPEAQGPNREKDFLLSLEGKYVCVSGMIESRDGIPQIEAKSTTPFTVDD